MSRITAVGVAAPGKGSKVLAVAALVLAGCADDHPAGTVDGIDNPGGDAESAGSPPNILLIIADDAGVEQFAPFGIGEKPASTPNLDALAARGMRFDQVWAPPLCSPTRATLLTGRYAFRTGVGTGVSGSLYGPYPEAPEIPAGSAEEVLENVGPVRAIREDYSITPFGGGALSEGLPLTEVALPSLLKTAPGGQYRTAAIGKWHLATESNGWMEHASAVGFDHYSLLMKNQPESYFAWWENINGSLVERSGYTPTQKVDDAIQWVNENADRPWFLWLALNLPHFPHHVPDGMEGDAADLPASLDRMIERMDEEIGRLLAGLGESEMRETVVIFIGDNGTTGVAIDPPFDAAKAKFTVYEGGLRVPLLFAGPGVPAGESSGAFVNTTDVFATVLDIAGVPLPEDRELDSISLAPYFAEPQQPSVRTFLYADQFFTSEGIENGGFAYREGRWKLVRNQAVEELYDLESDPYEASDLLADGASSSEQEILDTFYARVRALHESEQ